MTATDLDLDALLDALVARARARPAPPLVNEAGVEVSPLAATGRLIVNPGDVIASVWGNTTYDQTVQTYTSNADRDGQWPTPKDGAVAYTADTQTVWVRRAGAWKAVPFGWAAQAVGPATAVNCGATATTIMTLPVSTLVAGRRYKLTAGAMASQQTSTGTGYVGINDNAGYITGTQRLFSPVSLPAGNYMSGTIVIPFTATGTAATFTLVGTTSAGALQVAVNWAQILLEDIGV